MISYHNTFGIREISEIVYNVVLSRFKSTSLRFKIIHISFCFLSAD